MTAEPAEKEFDSSEIHTGDPEQLATWEVEQRQYFAERGVTDFEFTHEPGRATVRYNFYRKRQCAKCQAVWTGDWCVKCGGQVAEYVHDFTGGS